MSKFNMLRYASPWPYLLPRLIVAASFLYAVLAKLPDIDRFAQAISDYGIVYEGLTYPTAVALLVAEALVGLGLLVDLRGALTSATALLLLFAAVLVYGIALGLDIECGCFGFGEDGRAASLEDALARTLVLLALCAYLHAYRRLASIRPRGLLEWWPPSESTQTDEPHATTDSDDVGDARGDDVGRGRMRSDEV